MSSLEELILPLHRQALKLLRRHISMESHFYLAQKIMLYRSLYDLYDYWYNSFYMPKIMLEEIILWIGSSHYQVKLKHRIESNGVNKGG